MKVKHLAKHPDVIPTLAAWVYDQWGHRMSPDTTLERLCREFESGHRFGAGSSRDGCGAGFELEELYLFTPDEVSFYGRLGWKVLECREHHRTDVTVMVYEFE